MRHVIAVALAAALLAGCGGDDSADSDATSAAPPAAAVATIRIADFLYDPDPATVKAGRKIAIVNADDAPHTLTEQSAKRSFDSDTILGNKRGSVTFTKPGTFKFFCLFHPTMKGTVTVTRQ